MWQVSISAVKKAYCTAPTSMPGVPTKKKSTAPGPLKGHKFTRCHLFGLTVSKLKHNINRKTSKGGEVLSFQRGLVSKSISRPYLLSLSLQYLLWLHLFHYSYDLLSVQLFLVESLAPHCKWKTVPPPCSPDCSCCWSRWALFCSCTVCHFIIPSQQHQKKKERKNSIVSFKNRIQREPKGLTLKVAQLKEFFRTSCMREKWSVRSADRLMQQLHSHGGIGGWADLSECSQPISTLAIIYSVF